MKLSTSLPGTKIVMVADYKSPSGKILPTGLMLSVRGLELTIHRKYLRLLAIRNKDVIESLYEGVPEDSYIYKRQLSSDRIYAGQVFYTFHNDELQNFLENAQYRVATDLYQIITTKKV
jgi:hypothetical protein